jgi:parvulin-like peptidyl-prolyl isomerase
MLPGVVGAKRGQRARTGDEPRRSGGRQRLGLIVFAVVFVALFIGFAVAQGIGSPSVASGDVALVQSVPSELGHISKESFDHAIAQQVAEGKLKKTPAPGSKKYEELKSAAMRELLERVWLQGEAEELEITVTDKQVETELENIKKTNFPSEAAFNKFLKESHLTADEVNERVKLQVLTNQIREQINSEAQAPSSSEIEDYYEAEKATQFTTKETRDVRVIVNKDKKKVEEAKAALEKDNSPASWKKVAPKFSEDPTTSKNGGLQKGIAEEFLTGAIKNAIFGSATGELVGPVQFEKTWLLVEVVKLNPAKVKTLGEVKKQITETLTQEKQQETLSEFASAYQQKWTARTFCASGFEVEQCANYKGSGHPASANPACYEANPKTPAKECPAPVTPISPALPGSISEKKPKGEPFPQRPIPESSGTEASSEIPATTTPPPTGE